MRSLHFFFSVNIPIDFDMYDMSIPGNLVYYLFSIAKQVKVCKHNSGCTRVRRTEQYEGGMASAFSR